MSKPLLDSAPERPPLSLPADLPLSTVSEITSWLVGHRINTVERELILHTLDHCSGNRGWTASILGISPRSLEQKLRGYARQGIAVPQPCEDEDSIDLADELELEVDALQQDNESGRRDPRWLVGAGLAATAILLVGFAALRLFGGNQSAETAVSVPAPTLETSIYSEAMPVSERTLASSPNDAAAPARTALRPVDIEQDTRMDSTATNNGGADAVRAQPAENKREGVASVESASNVDAAKQKKDTPEVMQAAVPAGSATKNNTGKPIEAVAGTTASINPAEATETPQADDEEAVPNPPKRPAKPAAPAARPAPTPQAQARPAAETSSFPILFPFGGIGSPKGERSAADAATPVVRPPCCGD